jgi:eukaryotic-like serine/threonine-protein kinase
MDLAELQSTPQLDAVRWRQVDALLDAALDRDPAEWSSFLDAACTGDRALRAEVDALLAEYGRHEAHFATGAGAVAAAFLSESAANVAEARQVDQLVGARLGPWRIERQVGSGGMARVFLGERDDGEFAQRVAIKVLRAGLDTPAEVARFRAERRILAALDHPNIARLFDGGVAPDGRPYLVLEYVDGEPLTTWCDAHSLDVPARLRMFLSVADAVQAAHRQLVVHRDLKPSNILVGADGRPRLLDFGIARILEVDADDENSSATTRRRWLTPGYAAPEQFTGGAITTATDVYQLGATLYELLTGHRPFESPAVTSGKRGAMLETRVLREDPPRPSTHVSALEGDLDAVILKALRREPAARYATVAAMAEDIRRALTRAPVAARDGERAYRWGRTLRRRAVPITIAATALLAVAGYGLTVAAKNRRIEQALADATAEQQKAAQASDLLLGLFKTTGGQAPLGDSVTAGWLLSRAESQADGLDPEAQAALLVLVGRIRFEMGAYDAARTTIERALSISRRTVGDDHPDVTETVTLLAAVAARAGRYPAAAGDFRAVLAQQRAARGDTAVNTQYARFGLASSLHFDRPRKNALDAFAEWQRVDSSRERGADAATADDLIHKAQIAEYTAQMRPTGRSDSALLAAERDYRKALSIKTALFGERHGDVAAVQHLLGLLYSKRGNTDSAIVLLDRAVTTMRAIFPQGHQDLAAALMSQGNVLMRGGMQAHGLATMREGLTVARALGEDHPLFPHQLLLYGYALRQSSDTAAAEPVLREAVTRLARAANDANDLITANARAVHGDVLGALGRHEEAETGLLTAYAALTATRAASDRYVQGVLKLLVKHYERAGRATDAARYSALITPPAAPPP